MRDLRYPIGGQANPLAPSCPIRTAIAANENGAARSPNEAPLRVAYFVNQYPKVSHSFIRREIHALERAGIAVERFALRGWDADVIDPADIAEIKRTTFILERGGWPLLRALSRTVLKRPRAFASALAAALSMGGKSSRPLPYHLVYLAEACALLEAMMDRNIVHLHAHFGTNSAEIAMLVRLLGGPPYSFTVHGPEEIEKMHTLHLDKKAAHAKWIIAISVYCRDQLCRVVAPKDQTRIRIVHCGIEPGFYADNQAGSSVASRFVCVGRLSEEKGQMILLEAMRRVCDQRKDCVLVLAGEGHLRGQIETRIRELDLQDNVRITGWISSRQVRDEILAARALVSSSFSEGLPVVIMEAMALGRPVIATSIAAVPELVVSGEHGWLVAAGDAALLADAMERCLQAPAEQLTRMGGAARDRVLERHDVDREAAKLAAYFGVAHVHDDGKLNSGAT